MTLRKEAIIKAVALAVLLVLLVFLTRSDMFRENMTKESIGSLLESAGWIAPILFIALFGIGSSMLVPATVFVALGAFLFGTWWGFVFSVLGATLAAMLSFLLARTLGHEFAQHFFGETVKKYDKKISENGFVTVFYMRMLLLPFAPLNYGCGLTRVAFRDYVVGTFIGIIPSIFFVTFLFSSISEVILEYGFFSFESLTAFFSWRILLAGVLFLLSLCIPLLLRKHWKK